MPYNPITGEFDYGGESYDAPTAGIGAAMSGMGAVGADIPLAFRMMENMPGITASAMFNARRFSNTMMSGGFLDVSSGASASQVNRARKFGAFANGLAPTANKKGFVFGKYRDKTKMSGSTQFAKASRVNNLSLRPRIFNRMSSVSNLSGVANKGYYTPFQGASFLDNLTSKTKLRSTLVNRGVIARGSDEPLFSGGTLGRVSTMSRVYDLEKRSTNQELRMLAGDDSPGLAKRSQRTRATLSTVDENIFNLNRVNAGTAGRRTASTISSTGSTRVGMTGMTAQDRLGYARMSDSIERQAISSNRLRAVSDTSKGVISRGVTQYMGTMLDPTQFKGTGAYANLERNITKTLFKSSYDEKVASGTASSAARREAMTLSKSRVGQFLGGEAVDDVGRFGVRSLASLSKTAMSSGQKGVAAKLAAASGSRALGLAMPALNVVGTAALVYDLTKLAATGVVSAGNFAKDAVKSMQGSIHKPVFGMGYQDTEVAATSRSRGVMAIQNSRLNARSALGSEASMMAAHFG